MWVPGEKKEEGKGRKGREEGKWKGHPQLAATGSLIYCA